MRIDFLEQGREIPEGGHGELVCRLEGLVVVVLAFNWTLEPELVGVIVCADAQLRTLPESSGRVQRSSFH